MSVIHSVLTRLDARGAPRPAALGAMPPLAAASCERRFAPLDARVGGRHRRDRFCWRSPTGPSGCAAPARRSPRRSRCPWWLPQLRRSKARWHRPHRRPRRKPHRSQCPQPRRSSSRPPKQRSCRRQRRAASRWPRRCAKPRRSSPPSLRPARSAIDKRPVALSPSQRAVLLLRQAHESAQAGQPRAALALARDALALDPELAGARLLAAVLEHETGASERAAQLLRDGLVREPQTARRRCCWRACRSRKATPSVHCSTLEQHPVRGAEADGLRAGILARQGDYARALHRLRKRARASNRPTRCGGSAWVWRSTAKAMRSVRARPTRARWPSALPRDDLTHTPTAGCAATTDGAPWTDPKPPSSTRAASASARCWSAKV